MTDTLEPKAARDTNAGTEHKSSLMREPLSPEALAHMREHIERTGVGAMRLLRGAKDKPSGLKSSMVVQWLRGATQMAAPAHVAYLLARWSALPTNRRLPLTTEMRAQLNAEFRRTGSGPAPLLNRVADVPPGLTRRIIQSWTSGGVKPSAVGETYWNYVMARLRSMPDHVTTPAQFVETLHQHKLEITAAEFAELHHHRQRTGIGGAILLRDACDKPAGLTPGMISAWLSRQATRAAPGFVAYVLARYRAWP